MKAPQSSEDEDTDLRELLQATTASTSAAHDSAVLQAARNADRQHQTPRLRRRIRQVPALGWSCAAALLLLVIGGVWREYGSRQTTLADGRLSVPELITPGGTRGTVSLPLISIPAGINTVQLHLEVSAASNEHNSELSLATRSGKDVWHGTPLEVHDRDSHRILTVDIPVSVLAPGEYELSVHTHQSTAAPQVDYYYFQFATSE